MSAFIAGINNSPIAGAPVLVNSSGQLGVLLSSERYKEDIQDMGKASAALMQLVRSRSTTSVRRKTGVSR